MLIQKSLFGKDGSNMMINDDQWWSMMINDDHDGSSEVTKRQKESWRSSQTRPSTDVACCLSRLRCLPVELLGAVGMAGIETLKQAPSGLWRFCPQILLMLEWMLLVIVIIVIVLCTFPSQVRSMDAKSLLRMLLVQYCSSLANSCSYASLFQFAWSLPPRCQEFRFKDYEHYKTWNSWEFTAVATWNPLRHKTTPIFKSA